MKTYTKFLLTVGLLSLASAGLLQAQTVVRITGSSAYRGAVTNAILHLLTSPTAGYANFTGSAPTSLAGANEQIIEGTLTTTTGSFTAGTSMIFKTSWTGSISGIIALTTNGNTVNPFLSASNTGLASATAGTGSDGTGATGGALLSSAIFDSAQVADVAMSDVFQSSTQYTSPALGSPGTLTDSPAPGVVGVIPFVWVAGAADSTSKITNINSDQIQQLLAGGLAESQLTGNFATDSGTLVLPVGRDADSGTRFNAFAESGYNILGIKSQEPTQYFVITSGGGADVEEYPAESLPTIGSFSIGQGGYSSGSSVATDLSNVNTNNATTNGINNGNPAILIGYLSEGDAKTAVTNNTGAHFLSYNGVTYGTYSGGTVTFNRNLVDQGVYSFWGYEHMYYRSGNADAAIANALATQIANVDAPVSGEVLSNMQVSRGQEGAPIGFGQP